MWADYCHCKHTHKVGVVKFLAQPGSDCLQNSDIWSDFEKQVRLRTFQHTHVCVCVLCVHNTFHMVHKYYILIQSRRAGIDTLILDRAYRYFDFWQKLIALIKRESNLLNLDYFS